MIVQACSNVGTTIVSAFTQLEVASGMLRMTVVNENAHLSILVA
jgi:hypothetical protein